MSTQSLFWLIASFQGKINRLYGQRTSQQRHWFLLDLCPSNLCECSWIQPILQTRNPTQFRHSPVVCAEEYSKIQICIRKYVGFISTEIQTGTLQENSSSINFQYCRVLCGEETEGKLRLSRCHILSLLDKSEVSNHASRNADFFLFKLSICFRIILVSNFTQKIWLVLFFLSFIITTRTQTSQN